MSISIRKIFPYIISFIVFSNSIFAQRWIPEDDFKHLNTFASVLDKTIKELSSIKPIKKDNNEYFTNEQYDKIERLYFRFTLCTKSLVDIVNAYTNFSDRSKYSKKNSEAFLLGYCATLTIYKYSAELILSTSTNQKLIDKLNEEFPRVEIKGGGLDYIISNLTNPSYINSLDVAREFFLRRIEDGDILIDSKNPEIISPELMELTKSLSTTYQEYKNTILDQYTILPIQAADIMQVSVIEETVNEIVDAAGDQLKAFQEFIFTLWGDVRIPLVEGIKFSRKQKMIFNKLLKPGDILLTFSSGYLSNIFLPGYFKHVLTYTGKHDPKSNKYLAKLSLKPEQKKLIKKEHNIIEAISEGVRTNNIENYYNGYADRIIVFRPNLNDDQIINIMNRIHSYLGNDYDFDFDLTNGEKQTCSEIIYRSYNGIGNIDLDLEEIFGTTTLSSGKLLEYFIADRETELIILAVENNRKPGKALLLQDEKAIKFLKEQIPNLLIPKD